MAKEGVPSADISIPRRCPPLPFNVFLAKRAGNTRISLSKGISKSRGMLFTGLAFPALLPRGENFKIYTLHKSSKIEGKTDRRKLNPLFVSNLKGRAQMASLGNMLLTNSPLRQNLAFEALGEKGRRERDKRRAGSGRRGGGYRWN